MKTDPEKIPAVVFDWIQQQPFETLDATRKKEVLRYMTAADYNDMHGAWTGIRQVQNHAPASGKAKRKKELLEHFARHQRNQGLAILLWQPVALWKAAAVIAVVLTGWVFFYLNEKQPPAPGLVARVDTVYVTKETPVQTVKVYDTVYITRHKETSSKNNVSAPTVVPVTNGSLTGSEVQVNTLPVKELESTPNQPRGNSMKDDTLLKRFSFVTM